MNPTRQTTAVADEQDVSWNNFVGFVRQLSHDLRNQLNAVELQSALIGEITADAELKSEVQRLRGLVSKLGISLQNLSASVADPRPTCLTYSAADLVSDLRNKIAHDFPEQATRVIWEGMADGAVLEIDPALIESAVVELFANAFRHGGGVQEQLRVFAAVEGQNFTFALSEPKEGTQDPAQWTLPLRSISNGHYNLGLRRVRRIVEAHGGNLTARFDSSSSRLTSTITLPCSTTKN